MGDRWAALLIRTEEAGTVYTCGPEDEMVSMGERFTSARVASGADIIPCCRDTRHAGVDLACHRDDADEEVSRCRLLLTVALARADGIDNDLVRVSSTLVDNPVDGAAGVLERLREIIGA